MEHTKGEWESKYHEQSDAYIVTGENNELVAYHSNKANAERICLCVNSHDALLAVCERLLESYCNMAQQLQTDFQFQGDQLTQQAEQAIAAAKNE